MFREKNLRFPEGKMCIDKNISLYLPFVFTDSYAVQSLTTLLPAEALSKRKCAETTWFGLGVLE
jgi:hypothetical protein